MLQVEREEAYSDSFVVEEGPMIRLPTIGEVSLAGVLRSEMEAHLTRELARYIRDPVVRARTSIRIAVLGAVGRPGFYAMPVQYLVTDVLAGAGQVSGNADIGKISIERAGKAIWSNEQLEPEIIEGRTLDQLGVRAGDRIVVGSKRRFLSVLQSSQSFLYLFLGLPPAIIGFITLIT
jgi:protein involved in polysaccharide export with SLBB domain